jgi:hypothetical protein
MLFHDPLSGSAVLALGLVSGFCLYVQIRLARPLTALALTWLAAPLLYLLAEPFLYSPTRFFTLLLPRLPSFLANTFRLYPTFAVNLAPIPLLCVLAGVKRRAAAALDLT